MTTASNSIRFVDSTTYRWTSSPSNVNSRDSQALTFRQTFLGFMKSWQRPRTQLHQLPHPGQGCTKKSMFSRLLHTSAAFLLPYIDSQKLDITFQVDEQIRSELEQAAEQGMVSTRSQDNTPTGGASHSSQELYPQVVVVDKKRKAIDGAKESPAQAVTKRRRRSAKSNGDAAPSSSARKPGRPRKRPYAETVNGDTVHAIDLNGSESEPSTQSSRSNSPQTPKNTIGQTNNDDKEDRAIKVVVDEPDHNMGFDDEVLEAYDQVKPYSDGATRSRKGKTPKKRTKDSDGIAGADGNGADISTLEKKPETYSATTAKASHKRFGSEDIEVLGTVPSAVTEGREGGREDLADDESESEDEAPETVTVSAGFDKARASTLDAAKVAARQKADKKFRRREHDQRLRLQAKSAKDTRSMYKPSIEARRKEYSLPEVVKEDAQVSVEKPKSSSETPRITHGEGQIPQKKPKPSGKTPLPLLLPEEILAAEPIVHAPLPPFSNSKLAVSQKRKNLNLEPKPPKDIKRGNVNVRVLQDNRSNLPPKSSQASKALREYLLTGRKGHKGEMQVPRRKPSGGFVRKK